MVVLWLAVVGCSDGVATKYANLAAARQQGAFEHGWLLPVLPDSVSNIFERHDLDLNTGAGSFDYAPTDRDLYMQSLREHGAVVKASGDSVSATLNLNDARWDIHLPKRISHAGYSMRSLKR